MTQIIAHFVTAHGEKIDQPLLKELQIPVLMNIGAPLTMQEVAQMRDGASSRPEGFEGYNQTTVWNYQGTQAQAQQTHEAFLKNYGSDRMQVTQDDAAAYNVTIYPMGCRL